MRLGSAISSLRFSSRINSQSNWTYWQCRNLNQGHGLRRQYSWLSGTIVAHLDRRGFHRVYKAKYFEECYTFCLMNRVCTVASIIPLSPYFGVHTDSSISSTAGIQKPSALSRPCPCLMLTDASGRGDSLLNFLTQLNIVGMACSRALSAYINIQ